jgi:NlpC/P60 family
MVVDMPTVNAGSGGGVSSSQDGTALAYMMAQVGHPYSEEIPERFGPHVFDCSGLVWAAFHHAGTGMPGGPNDDAAGIVDPELQWLAKQPGATVIRNKKNIEKGDVIGFQGADPPGGTITVGGNKVAGMGHIGMAVSNTKYVSAYDTQEGVVVNPIAGDVFTVAVRPAGGGPTGGSDNSPNSGAGGSLDSALSGLFPGIASAIEGALGLGSFGDLVERGVIILAGLALIVIGAWRMA